MTNSQLKFFHLLDQVPRIKHLWDKKTESLNVDLFERELSVMSPSESHLAKFFASVWFGSNRRYPFDFDLVDAVSTLDKPEQQLIIKWINNPFWP